jgi:hypothetical protein
MMQRHAKIASLLLFLDFAGSDVAQAVDRCDVLCRWSEPVPACDALVVERPHDNEIGVVAIINSIKSDACFSELTLSPIRSTLGQLSGPIDLRLGPCTPGHSYLKVGDRITAALKHENGAYHFTHNCSKALRP